VTSAAKYRTIVADPPWPVTGLPVSRTPAGVSNDGRIIPVPYPTMTLEEIKALPVRELAASSAHLYLWTTNGFLREAFDVADAWGFRYSQTLVWCKKPIGSMIGGTWRMSTEFVLACRRGSLASTGRQNANWFQLPRSTTHSRKPEAFLDMVEQVSPGPYLELFARRQRLGWDTWGNQSLEHVEVSA